MNMYIVDRIGYVVEQMRPKVSSELLATINSYNKTQLESEQLPFFKYGHPVEINNSILEKSKDRVNKFLIYPMIGLKMDIAENVRGDVTDYVLNLAIMNYTDRNYTAEERITNVFKPILHPLYELFMDELKNSGKFFWSGDQYKPQHTKIDRPYWGAFVKNKNEESTFTDPLDAVEIINLRLSSYKC